MPGPTVALIVRADSGTAPLNAPVTVMTKPVGAGPVAAGSQNNRSPFPDLDDDEVGRCEAARRSTRPESKSSRRSRPRWNRRCSPRGGRACRSPAARRRSWRRRRARSGKRSGEASRSRRAPSRSERRRRSCSARPAPGSSHSPWPAGWSGPTAPPGTWMNTRILVRRAARAGRGDRLHAHVEGSVGCVDREDWRGAPGWNAGERLAGAHAAFEHEPGRGGTRRRRCEAQGQGIADDRRGEQPRRWLRRGHRRLRHRDRLQRHDEGAGLWRRCRCWARP